MKYECSTFCIKLELCFVLNRSSRYSYPYIINLRIIKCKLSFIYQKNGIFKVHQCSYLHLLLVFNIVFICLSNFFWPRLPHWCFRWHAPDRIERKVCIQRYANDHPYCSSLYAELLSMNSFVPSKDRQSQIYCLFMLAYSKGSIFLVTHISLF